MARLVLDADTITYILQRRLTVVARLAAAVRENSEVYVCPVVYYQIRRVSWSSRPRGSFLSSKHSPNDLRGLTFTARSGPTPLCFGRESGRMAGLTTTVTS